MRDSWRWRAPKARARYVEQREMRSVAPQSNVNERRANMVSREEQRRRTMGTKKSWSAEAALPTPGKRSVARCGDASGHCGAGRRATA